ncbi:Transcriptional activator of fatty acid utilization [Mortierella sp. GBA43]|nr:Transcriptional activator of fatty acid utilization [Mortierella sp. GBA43]
MADSKRLRVSKVRLLCLGTYNDPTKKRGPPKGKLAPMMTGYIEAIEARLHRMEGLLGGLVKDKDPRAEIVRAELDAMAREAEMTGLKLRRSKAYEEINHAMAGASSSSSSSSMASPSGSMPAASTSRSQGQYVSPPSQQPQPPQQTQQQTQQQQHRPGTQQPPVGYRPHTSALVHSDTSPLVGHTPSRSQPVIQPSPAGSPAPRQGHYHPYDTSRHPHQRPQHALQGLHSQSSSGSNLSYQKQHHPAGQPVSSHFTASYGDAGSSSPGSQVYPDSRSCSSNSRPAPYTTQSHHQSQSLNEKDHYRSSTGHNANGSSSSFAMTQRHGYSNGASGYPVDSRQLVTHRPSLTAHQLSDPMTGYMDIPQTTSKDVALIMPAIDVIDHLLGVHFQYIHPVLPMLDFRSISDQIHRNESPPSHLLFAVLGLASRFSDNAAFRTPQPDVERPPCTIFYERAKFFIKDEYDNSQIATVQALLLMSIQQMGFCESQRAWLYIGLAIRMAVDLGLNKEPSAQEQSRNRLQCELRRRTWWSLYVVERLVCTGLGKSLSISHRDCEAGFPQPEDDRSEMISSGMLATQSTHISDFIHLISLARIQGDILEFVRARHNSTGKPTAIHSLYAKSPIAGADQDREQIETSAATFSLLDKSLIEWRQNLPEVLQNPTAQSPHFGLFLHLTFNTLIILLHRPEVPHSQTSASLCTQAAVTISEIVEILMDAKALTSMFVTCLYAIFSAGIVHFMNIPSVQRSSTSSPVLPEPKGRPLSSTNSAKANLKRCIDALKFLSNHWVSAGRRAKVLEDLLDLKHVSLKDLEVNTFNTSPVEPSWVLQSEYKDALIGPREGQDKLRQQCRSKVMAIHSLLANDDEFKRMQKRPGTFSEQEESGDEMESADEAMDEDEEHDTPMESQPIGLGLENATTEPLSEPKQEAALSTTPHKSRSPTKSSDSIDIDVDHGNRTINPTAEIDLDGPSRPAAQESGILTPVTMTTMANRPVSPMSSVDENKSEPRELGSEKSSNSSSLQQAAMLDPFSVPSSISFSEWNHDRRPNNSTNVDGPAQLSTVWTTDAITNRTTARSTTNSPMIPPNGTQHDSRRDTDGRKTEVSTPTMPTRETQPLSLYHEAISHAFPGSKLNCREDQDLVWNDMPPTLGLDEWTAYIGAMMMRWLYASGQSSPGSASSP